jgi:CRISPR-associated exonuclease Cas4
MNSIRVRQGLVEYARSGIVREVEIRSIDRARALRICYRVRQIRDGQLPDRPRDAPCDQCRMKERCETRATLASKFF